MAIVHRLDQNPSAISHHLRFLRDVQLQGNRDLFRRALERVGAMMGFELSKQLPYADVSIRTPMAAHQQSDFAERIVIVSVLRAGLPLQQGLQEVFPNAELGFISAYRKHNEQGDFHIELGYAACPNLDGCILILCDPMLATGQSFLAALKVLETMGTPAQTHHVAVIASEQGVQFLADAIPASHALWLAAVDPKLDEHSYIVPGLGDAGDLAFGPKLQR